MPYGPHDFWEAPNANTFEAGFLQDPRFFLPFAALELGSDFINSPAHILKTIPKNATSGLTRAGALNAAHDLMGGRSGPALGQANAGLYKVFRSRKKLAALVGAEQTGGFMNREAQLYNATRAKGGAAFANRALGLRTITGLSKGMIAIGLLEAGFMVGGMVASAIGGYEPEGNPYGRRDLEIANNFVDTRSAQTQRARAIQAIHNSHLSTRAVFGNEAAMMHHG